MQWLLSGRFPSGIGGYSELIHSAGLPLPRPLSTAKITNTVAGRPPLLAQHPAHPKIPISQGPIARCTSRLPNWVRPSVSTRRSLDRHQNGLSTAPQHPCACLVNVGRCSTDRRGMRILWTGGAKCPLTAPPRPPPSRTPRCRPDSRHVLSRLGRVAREIAKLKQFSSLSILRPNVTIRYAVPCRMSLGVARATVTSGVG